MAPVASELAAAFASIVNVLELGTVNISNSPSRLAAEIPPTAPLTLAIVTKSPINAPCDESVTVTVVLPLVVANCVMLPVPVDLIGVMSA